MNPVSFCTLRDIHNEFKNNLDHSAEIEEETIYIDVDYEPNLLMDDDEKLKDLEKQIRSNVDVKELTMFHHAYQKKGVLIILTFRFIRNTIKPNKNTRVAYILDELPVILNEIMEDPLHRILIEKISGTFNKFPCVTYKRYKGPLTSMKIFNIDIKETYIIPLLRQLDSFIGE